MKSVLTTVFLLALPGFITLSGCSTGVTNPSAPVSSQANTFITGRVLGGHNPITGASITLWQVNTNGTAATSMLVNPVTTGTGGTFSITNDYPNGNSSCTATTEVYILATGGNPGLSGTNSAISLMAALGPCLTLQQGGASINIDIDEVTTVAAVWALQQFIGVSEGTAGAEDVAVNSTSGLSAQSATGMANAFLTAQMLASNSTGLPNSTYGNASIESAKISTLANVLSTCVNSSGPTSYTCQSLFSAVTPAGSIYPGDTIQAALYIAQNPTYNVSTIFGLQQASPPFATDLSTAPFDWSVAMTYSGSSLDLPNLVAADGSGNIWVTNAASGAESLTKIAPGGVFSSYLTMGSTFDGPQADVIDTSGNVWITANSTNGTTGNRLVELKTASSTSASYSLSSVGNCYPDAAAIDGSNDIFFACNGLSTPTLYEMAAASPGSYVSIGSLNGSSKSYGLAIDSDNNIWAANTGNETMTEFTDGVAGATSTINNFSLGSAPYSVAIDSNNNAWAVNSDVLEEFAINSKTSSNPSYTSTDYTGSGLNSGAAMAIDANGNIWAANRSVTTISGVSYLTLSEFNSAGSPVGTSNTSVQPGGLSNSITVNSVNVSDAYPRGLAIDPSGNVWIAGCGQSTSCSSGANSFVMEFVGVAAPTVLPLSSAIAANKLACCSYTAVAPSGTSPAATPGYVGLQASTTSGNAAFTQNSGTFYFLVTRTGGFTSSLSVEYSYGPPGSGTAAVYGTDYTDATSSSSTITPYSASPGYGTLTWTNGDSSSRTIGPINWLDTTANGTTKSFVINLSCSGCTGYNPYQSETVAVTAAPTAPASIASFNKYLNSSSEGMYVGLPIDEYGGTGGLNGAQYAWQTVATSSLTNFSDTYFYATTATVNGTANIPVVVFTVPSNGAVSSPGSGTNDARSEMREYYNSSTGNLDGNDWDTAVGGTLTATVAVNSTSADSTETTIGQIHGQNQPYALVQYQPACTFSSVNYTGCVVLAYTVTNSTNSGSGTPVLLAYGIPTCSVSNLSSCTFFTYTLQIAPNSGSPRLNASVTSLNGGTGTINSSASISVDSSWIGTSPADGLYFKFGAYSNAPNTGNPAGDQTQVTFAFPATLSGVCNVSSTAQYCISHP